MSLKCVDLYSLHTAAKIAIDDYRRYEYILSNRDNLSNLGEREKDSLSQLVVFLLENGLEKKYLTNFFYSYVIPHIGKEFDLLKFTNNFILSIELKSLDVGKERIKTQLLCNYKYLKYLSKELLCFTFVSDEKTIYKLTNDFKLVEANVDELITAIKVASNNNLLEIDSLFKPNDFLVSPIATPKRFLLGQYFLTTQQEFIQKEINKALSNNNVFKITGDAGTGKTLLLFDIGLSLSKNGNVLIVSCGEITDAHYLISDTLDNFLIISADQLTKEKIENYDYILVDESQRLSKYHYLMLEEVYHKKKVIYSIDPNQAITKEEQKNNINLLIDKVKPLKYKLSNRIRINNNLTNFIQKMFNKVDKPITVNFDNISLLNANNIEELNFYFASKDYLNYNYIELPNCKFSLKSNNTIYVNDLYGKDFDDIILVIDDRFYYEDDVLKSNDNNSKYYLRKVLYQALSRARGNVVIIFYKNKMVFKKMLKKLIK